MTTIVIDGVECVALPVPLYNHLIKSDEFFDELNKRNKESLTTKKAVAKHFGVSIRTIDRRIEDKILELNKHFYREDGKLVFVEEAILSLDKRKIA